MARRRRVLNGFRGSCAWKLRPENSRCSGFQQRKRNLPAAGTCERNAAGPTSTSRLDGLSEGRLNLTVKSCRRWARLGRGRICPTHPGVFLFYWRLHHWLSGDGEFAMSLWVTPGPGAQMLGETMQTPVGRATVMCLRLMKTYITDEDWDSICEQIVAVSLGLA